MSDVEGRAIQTLLQGLGPGRGLAAGLAPGRVTLVGEHVDYVGGRIVCMAVDLSLAVAVRPSPDGRWRAVSAGRRVERSSPSAQGDIGDRLFAAAMALRLRGVATPPLEMGVASDLPESAGLSSSAALTSAALVAMLRLAGQAVSADELVATALVAERDIVGVPCGELDQRAVVHSRADSVLALDCELGSHWAVPWPWRDLCVVVAASGETHDVGGAGYRARREAATRACAALGVSSCQHIGDRWRELPVEIQRFGRHIATETRRADSAIEMLEAGDVQALGRLIDESHESLRGDYMVSTERLDAMTAAARQAPGCYGARLVGAGFGGSAMALVEREAAYDCAAAMAVISGQPDATWLVEPAAGLEVTAHDVVVDPASAATAVRNDPPSRHARPRNR